MAHNGSVFDAWGGSASVPLTTFFNSASQGNILRFVIPPLEEKILITWSALPVMSAPYPLMLLMAYLSRRPGTWLWRLAIAPFACMLTLRSAFSYYWNPPFHIYNLALGLMGVPMALKILEFAISPHGMLKMGEHEPGLLENPTGDLDRTSDTNSGSIKPHSWRSPLVSSCVDALEVCCTMRGIGWQFGTGTNVYLAPEWRDTTNKARFIRQTSALWLLNYTLFDVVTYGLRLVPGLGTPAGGSIFAFGGDSVVKKYLISFTITFFTGTTFITGFEVVHQLITIFAVIVLDQEPSSCPHLFYNTWLAVSLHELWSQRWHQLLRQTFLILGGYPLSTARLLGFLVGTFVGSGLIHYWGTYAMGRGSDVHPFIFFSAQSIGVILERLWKSVTGRKVGGWLGRIWTILWVVGGIQWCINAWHERAFESEMFFPPSVSPAHRIVFPLLQHACDAMGISVSLVSPLAS
ncbi:hypothetical protein DL93DRAFT_2204159 [Clavulina sp. PMI_390]|nr:hypothetical protein DL93DRAFT_2204159 [Clavulina sp. PMI_390]